MLVKRVQIIFLMSSFVLFPVDPVFAQTGTEESVEENAEIPQGSSQDIVTIEEPAYEYFYWPNEDLNSFGLSSMGSGKSGTTLGTGSQRTSNLEVNPPPKRHQEDKGAEFDETGGDGPIPPGEEYTDAPGAVIETPSNPASDNPIYKWVDDEGNLHITNNLGDVPAEYREELYNRSVHNTDRSND
jgi:hypothetical protein